jgi:hypothetical protein
MTIGTIELEYKGKTTVYELVPTETRGVYQAPYRGGFIPVALLACKENGWKLNTKNKTLKADWERGGAKPMAKSVPTRRISGDKRRAMIYDN